MVVINLPGKSRVPREKQPMKRSDLSLQGLRLKSKNGGIRNFLPIRTAHAQEYRTGST